MERHCSNAQKVANFLVQHQLLKTLYPGLPSNSRNEIGRKQVGGFGGIISFYLKADLECCKRLMRHIRVFTLCESLGDVESLVEHPSRMTHVWVPKEERERTAVTDLLVRASVGIEDAEDLLSDWSTALDSVRRRCELSETKSTPDISFEEFKRIDARVATITLAERVQRTERLYKILVDLGPLGVRQTVSSLVGYYEASELVGKRVVFLYNLKPTKFAGEVSQGMLLAAEHGDKLALLTTDREIANGARMT